MICPITKQTMTDHAKPMPERPTIDYTPTINWLHESIERKQWLITHICLVQRPPATKDDRKKLEQWKKDLKREILEHKRELKQYE